MCSGVVPQHPPTSDAPASTNLSIASTNASGVSGYSVRPSTMTGSPALGTTEKWRGQFSLSHATCSRISEGPVAQFRPSEAIGNIDSAFAAAAISVPRSIVPVVSIVMLRPGSGSRHACGWRPAEHQGMR